MQVIDGHTFYAWCRDSQGARRRVDTALVGRQPEGTWLLVFMGVAREVLDAGSAALMNDALQALSMVMAGETEVDHLFPDLVGREPPLPDHLQHLVEMQGEGREAGDVGAGLAREQGRSHAQSRGRPAASAPSVATDGDDEPC